MDGWRWFFHLLHMSKSAWWHQTTFSHVPQRSHGTPRTGETYNLLSELRVHPGLCWKLAINEKPDETHKSSLTRDRRRRFRSARGR